MVIILLSFYIDFSGLIPDLHPETRPLFFCLELSLYSINLYFYGKIVATGFQNVGLVFCTESHIVARAKVCTSCFGKEVFSVYTSGCYTNHRSFLSGKIPGISSTTGKPFWVTLIFPLNDSVYFNIILFRITGQQKWLIKIYKYT